MALTDTSTCKKYEKIKGKQEQQAPAIIQLEHTPHTQPGKNNELHREKNISFNTKCFNKKRI